ncbi:DNA-processing protein DprA [Anaeromicropila populeti]|uniref:DNA processing protein n=1 Tax=Anaeromicropila populeti TaxID=37658 RepID=A0A1I6KX18_9FIRM|nr:DNA-processing protein DprA [Anaeromicropila populeti]SFR95782.1 DNA processing protein [Anaeromicropila populeti]
MNLTKQELWFWMVSIKGIGTGRIDKLLSHFHSPEEIYLAGKKELLSIGGIGEKCADALVNSRKEEKIHKEYMELQREGITFLTKESLEYPDKLRHFGGAPYGLYVKGKIPENDKITIAVIGARNCTSYGREIANYFGKCLAESGVQVISGLARGIDSHAHRGVISVGGETFAVLGSGINVCYPPEHIKLYNEILKKGGILSEYGWNEPPFAQNFPARNRIISGLSDGILVVEAKERSGSFITVDFGLEQGKDIFTVPGRIFDPLSFGCNWLAQSGAKIVTTPQDILEEYGIKLNKKRGKEKADKLGEKEKLVMECINLEAVHMNEIVEKVHIPLIEVMDLVVSLELMGLIRQTSKNYYIRIIQ